MCGEFLSIKEGKVQDIQMIEFKKQCPSCRNTVSFLDDTEMNMFIIVCGFCGKKYRIPIDDYHSVMQQVEYEV